MLKVTGGYRADLPHTADMELWFRLALKAPVGNLLAIQAYKRMHDENMQYQYVERTIGDLQQRQAAFDALFREHGCELSDLGRLQRLASRSLSLEAFWAASEAFDRADLDVSRKLLDFALATDPELRSRPEWTRFSIETMAGTKGMEGSAPPRLTGAEPVSLAALVGHVLNRIRDDPHSSMELSEGWNRQSPSMT